MYMSRFTPPIEPGMLPTARAITTFRRTVPFFRCIRLAGILVKKLNSASEPTAIIGGTLRPKISTGSSNTPPPTPLNPIRMPTTKPTTILASRSMSGPLFRLCCRSVYSDEAFPLKVQDNFLCGFLGRQLASVNRYLSIRRSFIGIGNARELLENSRARFRIEPLAVALLADFHRGRDVHENKAAERLNHLA